MVTDAVLVILTTPAVWGFGKWQKVKDHPERAREAVKVYTFTLVLSFLILMAAASSGLISVSDRTIPDTCVDCNETMAHRVGDALIAFAGWETDFFDGVKFILGLLALIIIPKALSAVYMRILGLPLQQPTQTLPAQPGITGLSNDQIAILAQAASSVKSLFDPWNYLYLTTAKVVILFGAVGSAVLLTAKASGWNAITWPHALLSPIWVSNTTIILATTVLILTDIAHAKMQASKFFGWLFTS